jgi:hypothetical protein
MSGVKSGVSEQEGQLSWIVPPNGSGPSAGDQTESDAKTAKRVWTLYQAAKRWKESGNFSEAKENWEYWNEKQWRYQRPNHLHMSIVNQVYPTIETFIGHFADNIPESVARSRDPRHGRVAEMATKLFNWANDINGVQGQNELITRSAAVTGFAVQRIDWDYSMDRQRGAPRFSFVDENTFFVSPWTKNADLSDSRYVVEAANIPIEIVRDLFPDKAELIRPGVWDGSLTPEFMVGGGSRGFAEYLTMPSGGGTVAAGNAASKPEAKDLCTVIRVVERKSDRTMRDMIVCNAITCVDDPIPYEDEEYPYVMYNVLRDKASAYGHSLVHWMKSTQDEVNLIHSYMMDGMRFSSVDRLVANQANLEEGKMLSNDPSAALVDQHPDGKGYYLLHQGEGGRSFLEVEELLIKRLNEKTGNVDILHGERPAGVTTLGAMEIIRDEANVLVKKMSIQLMDGMKRRDELCLNRLRQFMKDERTVRITGRGGAQEHITVNKKVGMGLDGEWIVANTIPEDFEADIDITPLPPGGVAAKFEQATLMLQTPAEDGLPLITRNTFMKMTEQDPQLVAENEEEIAVMAEEQAKAQQAEAAAAQGGVPMEEEEMSPDEMRVRAMRLLGGGS